MRRAVQFFVAGDPAAQGSKRAVGRNDLARAVRTGKRWTA